MMIVRLLAGAFLLLAAIAVVSDVTRTINGSGLVVTSLAVHWKAMAPQSLAAAQQVVSRSVHPWLWDPMIWRVLLLPSSLIFATIGISLAILGRRQRRVNIFIN